MCITIQTHISQYISKGFSVIARTPNHEERTDGQGDHNRACTDFAHCLMMLYICTKFHENIYKGYSY